MDIKQISPSLGAVVFGLNLKDLEQEDRVKELRALWLKYQVLVFRKQELLPQDFIHLALKFGSPDIYPFLKGLDGFPEITPVLKKETETVNFGGIWHSDTTYQPCPPMATMLYAL